MLTAADVLTVVVSVLLGFLAGRVRRCYHVVGPGGSCGPYDLRAAQRLAAWQGDRVVVRLSLWICGRSVTLVDRYLDGV